MLTGVGAVQNSAEVQMGETVAVFGLGGVGLAALLGARLAGASRIVAVDVLQSKLDLALELGATDVVLAGDEGTVENVRKATGGKGAHKAIETVGNAQCWATPTRPPGAAASPSPSACRTRARCCRSPRSAWSPRSGRCAARTSGRACRRSTCPRYVELYQAGRLPVETLLTHTIALDEINEGFDRLARGEAVRQAVVF